MKPLPLTFRKDKFDFTQRLRDGMTAIYSKTKPGRSAAGASFELVRIKAVQSGEMFGKPIEAHEAYPSSESWGSSAYTIPSFEAALSKGRGLGWLQSVKQGDVLQTAPLV